MLAVESNVTLTKSRNIFSDSIFCWQMIHWHWVYHIKASCICPNGKMSNLNIWFLFSESDTSHPSIARQQLFWGWYNDIKRLSRPTPSCGTAKASWETGRLIHQKPWIETKAASFQASLSSSSFLNSNRFNARVVKWTISTKNVRDTVMPAEWKTGWSISSGVFNLLILDVLCFSLPINSIYIIEYTEDSDLFDLVVMDKGLCLLCSLDGHGWIWRVCLQEASRHTASWSTEPSFRRLSHHEPSFPSLWRLQMSIPLHRLLKLMNFLKESLTEGTQALPLCI